MKKFINVLMTIFAPLAAAPTGWAIFAGMTERNPFPVYDPIAATGAISIIVVSLSATILISEAYFFKQTARGEFEESLIQPLSWSISILVVAVLAEIVLSLVIVVLKELINFGVLAFPIMTLAGAFAAAGHLDLQNRNSIREAAREKDISKEIVEQEKAEVEREEKRKAAREAYAERKQRKLEAKIKQRQEEVKQEKAAEKEKTELTCKFPGCGYVAEGKKQLAGHMRAHPIAKRIPENKEIVWSCPSCSTINNSDRKECRQCGIHRINENGSEKEKIASLLK